MRFSIVLRSKLVITFLLNISLFFLLFPVSVQAAQIYDMATTSNWNIRFDGQMLNEKIGYEGMTVADLDNDGKKDLIFATVQDHIYVVFNSLIESKTGTGNDLYLQSGSNYSIKFTGLTGLDYHVTTADLKGDGKQSLIIADIRAGKNSRTNSGSVYIIHNDLLASFGTTPGTTVDLSNTANFSIRFDGAVASHFFGYSLTATDLRNTGTVDLLIGAPGATYNGTGAGAFYIINNSLFSSLTGTANIVDMSTTGKYNVRFNGVASSSLGLRVLSTADFNNDGKQEIVVAAPNADYPSGRTNSGSIYIIDSSTFFSVTGTDNIITLTDSTNYGWRFDGAVAGDLLNFTPLRPIAYLESTTKPDLLISSFGSDNNTRTNSGSLFVIFNSLLPAYTGTGQTFDLLSSASYSLRFDGAGANYDLGGWGNATFDMNSDGKNDLSIASQRAVSNGRTLPGSIYYIENSKLFSYSGKNIDMATEANYDRRYDGPLSNSWLGGGQQFPADMNGDGQTDIVFGGDQTPYYFTDAGALYIIYNFPHTFSLDSVAFTQNTLPVTVTGSLTAPNSATVINGVQYQKDSNSPQGTWTACTAGDGAFDELSETFSCSVSGLSGGSHTIYFRAYDTNTSYTAVANMPSVSILITPSIPAPSKCNDVSPGQKAPWLYAATAQDSQSILLHFTDAADPVDHYALEFGTQSGNYPYGSINIGGKGLTKYLVQSLSPNTKYYFRLRAGNGCATGPWSNEIQAKTNTISQLKTLTFENSTLEMIQKDDQKTKTPDSNLTQREGYKVNVKVTDSKNTPIKGAKVQMHSKIQEAVTDENGIVHFNNVESGDHTVLIAYNGYEGQQSLNLTGDIEEFNLNITVQLNNVSLTRQVLIIFGILGIVIIGLVVLLLRAKSSKNKTRSYPKIN